MHCKSSIIRVKEGHYRLLDGNSMTTPHATEISHSEGGNIFSIDEVNQMFITRKLSVLRGFLPDYPQRFPRLAKNPDL
jgi:hypothetical protein